MRMLCLCLALMNLLLSGARPSSEFCDHRWLLEDDRPREDYCQGAHAFH